MSSVVQNQLSRWDYRSRVDRLVCINQASARLRKSVRKSSIRVRKRNPARRGFKQVASPLCDICWNSFGLEEQGRDSCNEGRGHGCTGEDSKTTKIKRHSGDNASSWGRNSGFEVEVVRWTVANSWGSEYILFRYQRRKNLRGKGGNQSSSWIWVVDWRSALREGDCDRDTSGELLHELPKTPSAPWKGMGINTEIRTNSPSAAWIRAAVKLPSSTPWKPLPLLQKHLDWAGNQKKIWNWLIDKGSLSTFSSNIVQLLSLLRAS